MEKGKWHRVNGKLVRKDENGEAEPQVKRKYVRHYRYERTADQLLNNWWNGLTLTEKLNKPLREED